MLKKYKMLLVLAYFFLSSCGGVENNICPGARRQNQNLGIYNCEAPICSAILKIELFPSSDPTKFYVCGPADQLFQMNCAPGTCFDAIKQTCVHARDWINLCVQSEATVVTNPTTSISVSTTPPSTINTSKVTISSPTKPIEISTTPSTGSSTDSDLITRSTATIDISTATMPSPTTTTAAGTLITKSPITITTPTTINTSRMTISYQTNPIDLLTTTTDIGTESTTGLVTIDMSTATMPPSTKPVESTTTATESPITITRSTAPTTINTSTSKPIETSLSTDEILITSSPITTPTTNHPPPDSNTVNICPGSDPSEVSPGNQSCIKPTCTEELFLTKAMFPSSDPTIMYDCLTPFILRTRRCATGRCFNYSTQKCVTPEDWRNSCVY